MRKRNKPLIWLAAVGAVLILTNPSQSEFDRYSQCSPRSTNCGRMLYLLFFSFFHAPTSRAAFDSFGQTKGYWRCDTKYIGIFKNFIPIHHEYFSYQAIEERAMGRKTFKATQLIATPLKSTPLK